MKRIFVLIVILSSHMLSYGQGGVWTWVKGDSLLQSLGNHGALGVADSNNRPPGRYQAVQWTDLDGNFWIFGGVQNHIPIGLVGFPDLWKYDPVANMWTWIKGDTSPAVAGQYGVMGVPSPANFPGGRGFGTSAWTDQQGHLWMHGGIGFDAYARNGTLDDMWMYDIPSNQWTWMKGADTIIAPPSYGTLQIAAASNTPGARAECNSAWVRSDGTLWTMGGASLYENGFNDIWKFDISTNNWTWMGGLQGTDSSYNFGILNVTDPSNLPPARGGYSHWQDSCDNFYIFGGFNRNFYWAYNDIWRYNSASNLWTWIGGDSSINRIDSFPQTCASGSNFKPSALFENRTTQMNSTSNIFWSFGGCTRELGMVQNELWYFDVLSENWTRVSGTDTVNSLGYFGVRGVPSINNIPPARFGECLWEDRNGVLWMWGGGDEFQRNYDDMWKFVPDTTCLPREPLSINRSGNLLTASISPNYQWQLNGTNIIGDTMRTINIIQNGIYTVVVRYPSACDKSASITVAKTGINGLDNTNSVSIYPNPASQSCTIQIANYGGESFNVKLFDIAGEVISTWSFAGSSSGFDVSPFASGVYLLQINDDKGGQVIRKLVIE